MRTNIVLDDELVAEVMKLTGAKSKREVVDLALREMVKRYRQRKILDLVGEHLLDPDYDVGEMRRRMGENAG